MSHKSSKIGKRVRFLREEAGLTQLDLADKSNLDVTTINRVENNVSTPKIDTLNKIAKALYVPIRKLIE